MPAKRAIKSTSTATGRERSKSAGRPSKSRSRTRSRSRSRKTPPAPKTVRTPASESKVRRRRSSSSSSSSSRSPLIISKTKSILDASGDKRFRTSVMPREVTPSRFSQRIIEKIETNRTNEYEYFNTTVSKPDVSVTEPPIMANNLVKFIRKHVCSSPVISIFCIIAMVPLFLWINLLVFLPAAADNKVEFLSVKKTHLFAGAYWPTNWRLYLEPYSLMFVFVYFITHALLTRFVPFGRRVGSHQDSRRMDYRCKGLASLIIFTGLFAFAQCSNLDVMKNLRPTELLPKYWLGLFGATSVLLFVSALVSYFASKRVPRSAVCKEGNTGNFFVDLCVGRSNRPHWFGIDWKMFFWQPTLVATLLFVLTHTCAEWQRFERISPAMLLVTIMTTMVIVDAFLFEHSGLSTYFVRYDGFGFLVLAPVLFMPFLISPIVSYIAVHPEFDSLVNATGDQPNYCNIARFTFSVVLFLLGYWIYRSSNNQKDLFWRQSSHPSFSALKVIHGPQSMHLLAGGWWGWVRHPNYLGDLLMNIAFALLAGFGSFIPWMGVIFELTALLHRIWRIEEHTRTKYGMCWRMYTDLVPYRLLPKVF